MTVGVAATDFTVTIMGDMGVSVTYYVVTKSVDAMTGEETTTFASGTSQTVVFFTNDRKFLWDKEGLIDSGDAYAMAPTTLGMKRYDKFTYDGQTYYIDSVLRRYVTTVTMCDFAVAFKVA